MTVNRVQRRRLRRQMDFEDEQIDILARIKARVICTEGYNDD